jgi:hypothetical protein
VKECKEGNVKQEASRHFSGMKRKILKDKINQLE